MVDHLTGDPKFEGSNPGPVGAGSKKRKDKNGYRALLLTLPVNKLECLSQVTLYVLV
jgi:hypothetical protein